MKQRFLLFAFALVSFLNRSDGQLFYDPPGTGYSAIVNFHSDTSFPLIVMDTATTPLWQLGRISKTFFAADSIPGRAMVTDTLRPYPNYANNWFILKIPPGPAGSGANSPPNVIIDFWHKYQTDSLHAGGVVEFSLDHGTSWENIVTCASSGASSINLQYFSLLNEPMFDGEPAFQGTIDTEQYSRLQLFDCDVAGVRLTSTYCSFEEGETIELRFRFVSDSTADTLAGWQIDSIKIESPGCDASSVPLINQNQLLISPNPTTNNTFQFPALENEQEYTLEIYDAMGKKLLQETYTELLHLYDKPKGVYFYKVSNGREYYSGQLVVE